MSNDSIPDYDSIPDTADLREPSSDEHGLAILSNTLAIRATRKSVAEIRRDIAEMRDEAKKRDEARERDARRIIGAILAGAVTMAGSVVGLAMERGEERAIDAQQTRDIARNDERLTHIERLKQQNGDGT